MVKKTLDPRHKILKRPPIYHATTSRAYVPIYHPFGYQVNIHANCVCNEEMALYNRHLVDRTYIHFNKRVWRNIACQTLKFYPNEYVERYTYKQIIDEYTGNKKRLYYQASQNLLRDGYKSHYSKVRMFVKPDRYPSSAALEKDPRAIQYRSPEFNLHLGQYIKPYEHLLYKVLNMGVISRTRVIAKGLNNYDRAELLLHKISHFNKPRFVNLDHSRFDSTINVEHLRTTHNKYLRCFRSRTLARLLRCQINNVAWSKGGFKYRAYGTRMSGDPDTALGNSIINADCIWGVFKLSGIDKFDFMLDGDDAVLILEQSDLHLFNPTYFEMLGFDSKVQIVNSLEQIDFCQSKIILADRPVFSRNPERVFSHSQVSRKSYPKHRWLDWLSAYGLCELATNQGVPVIQAYGHQLAELSYNPLFDEDMKRKLMDLTITRKLKPITVDARATYALAWGVPLDIQLLLERYNYTTYKYDLSFRDRAFKYKKKYNTYVRLVGTVATIACGHQSLAECSGSSWWFSSTTGPKLSGPDCL